MYQSEKRLIIGYVVGQFPITVCFFMNLTNLHFLYIFESVYQTNSKRLDIMSKLISDRW